MRRKLVIIASLILGLGALSAGIAIAASSGGDDQPLSGSALNKATAAALASTGGGTVIETEVGDDGAAYSVEVRRADGSVVEVELDTSFEVVGQERDDDGSDEQGEDETGED